MMEPRLKVVLQATLCITYAWFVGLPTISVIYDQGYSLTWGATKIFANHRIISVTETLLQKSEMSMPEEAGILAMIHNPILREEALKEFDYLEQTGLSTQEACKQGLTDPKYCENPESVDASLQTKEEFNAFLDNFEVQHQAMQAQRKTMKETIAKAETELQEFYGNFLTRIWLIVTHCLFLGIEILILVDKGRKLVKYALFSLAFFPFASYTRKAFHEVQVLELQGADHEAITDMLLEKYPLPNGMELSNYHLYILFYVGFDAIRSFYHWTLGTDQFDSSSSIKNPRNKIKKKFKKEMADVSQFYQYCAQGNKEKLKEVIRSHQHQIDINAVKDGNTALHLAINGDHHTVVQVLTTNFEHQIDTSVCNEPGGYNVLDLAVIKKNLKIFNLILKHTKNPQLSSLILAVATFQDQLIKPLKSKLAKSLQPEIKVELDIFCDLLQESKKKNLKNSGKESIRKNLEIRKQIIGRYLDKNAGVTSHQQNGKAEKMKMELKQEFECPICSEEMKSPLKIYACSNDHFLCSECLKQPKLVNCPICREDFSTKPPKPREREQRLLESLMNNSS